MLPSNDGDKRNKQRKSVDQHIKVTNTLQKVEIGSIVNLHEEGFMLIGDGQIRENCLYQLSFNFSDAVDGCDSLCLGAECLWIKETDSGTQYWSGFQIIDLSEKDKTTISKLIGAQ
ncbi:PilZ domain-containing protein [Agarilytica rhodophyticola]|uniref:PilZ domain-containing protein n=1 Tax=Agarilytica rhodophyticola TaxID=1737490 RepID=UPI000B349DB4|nr:PilZ domain-containing protein [Agarilytica rhodophyticola]